MKMRNKKSKYKYEFESGNYRMTKMRFCCFVFCFMMIPLNLLTSLTDTLYAKPNADPNYETSDSDFPLPQDTNSTAVHNLQSAGVSSAKERNEQRSKERLRQMIEMLRSIELSSQKPSFEPLVVSKQIEKQEPNEVPLHDIMPMQPEKSTSPKVETESQSSTGLINNSTLQMLKDLSQQPGELHNPFELGEVLFLSGHLREAAAFYQEALRRIDAKDIRMVETRAWILFQIGNCLRNSDMPAAAKIYGQLIAEYPNSPWTELAQAQVKLIEWLQKDEPENLIVGYKP